MEKGLVNDHVPAQIRPPHSVCAYAVVGVNGLSGTPRTARPVRLTLSAHLGGDIDGAWWPYTSSVASELPQLVSCLHKSLGEIVDIDINWPLTEGAIDLESIIAPKKAISPKRRHLRIMVIEGRDACAKLLVVPHVTSHTLGSLVMRCAAAMPLLDAGRNDKMIETAELVMRTAQVESANWTAQTRAV